MRNNAIQLLVPIIVLFIIKVKPNMISNACLGIDGMAIFLIMYNEPHDPIVILITTFLSLILIIIFP